MLNIDHPLFMYMFDAFLLMQCECYVLLATWSVSYGFEWILKWRERCVHEDKWNVGYPESEERERERKGEGT